MSTAMQVDRATVTNGGSVSEHCSLLREWLSLAGVEKATIRDMVAKHLTEMAHQHFDAQLLDAIEEEPEWLQPLCVDSRWRELLYDLFVANPDCALLQAAISELSKGVHAAEVASRPDLLTLIGGASSLQAFLGSLGTHLVSRRHGGSQEALDGVGCAGEAQFFCAQLLLRSSALADLGCSVVLEEALAGMAASAAVVHGQPSRRLQLLAEGVPRQSPLLSCLVSVLTAGIISPADAHTLHEQCQRGTELSALRQPAILRLLLQALFDPSRPPKPGPREQLLGVLVFASASAARRATGDGMPIEDGDEEVQAREYAHVALREAQAICERNEVREIRSNASVVECSYVVAILIATTPALWSART